METVNIKEQVRFEDVKILLVDDVLKNLQILANIFNDTKAKISFAMNGKHAVDQAEAFMPDLILLDISMPVMDGITACKLIKANPLTAHIPIIFLTARTETEDIVLGLTHGAADYITKPFQSAELLARVQTHIDLARTRQSLMTANKELSTRNQEMADLVAMRERMLSIIAHDLRNPIGNLNQLLEMIQTASLSEQDAEIFELCRTSATEAYSLLENLLNWARKQSKVANIKRETIDLHLLIWNSIRLYKAGLHKKKLDINIDVDPTHTAFCDTAMLDTVVRNLISNAIKFTPIHGLISIKTEVDDDKVNIKITDTGIGINEETIHKILETNQYFTTLGTDKEKGSGLGLMICKEFIERNNGSIKVESELNVGTSFTVVLPITNETLKTMNPV